MTLAVLHSAFLLAVVACIGLLRAVRRHGGQLALTRAELAAAQQQLGTTAAARRRLLGRLSHDLRTPLNSILGFAELMRDGTLGGTPNAEQQEALDDILTSARQLRLLVDEVLEAERA